MLASSALAGAEEFGWFATYYSFSIAWVAFMRSYAGEGGLRESGAASPDFLTLAVSRRALELAPLSAVVGGLLAGSTIGWRISALGLGAAALVVVSLQEVFRYLAVQSGSAFRAVVSECCWLLALCAALLQFDGPWSAEVMVAVWLCPALLALVPVLPDWRTVPRRRSGDPRNRRDSAALGLETLLAMLSTAGVSGFAGFFVGPVAAGQMRLLQSVFGPPSIGVDVLRKRLSVRYARSTATTSLARSAVWSGWVATAAVVAIAIVGWAALESDGYPGSIARQAWNPGVFAALGLAFVVRAAGTPFLSFVRMRGHMKVLLVARYGAVVPVLCGLIAGRYTASLTLVALGMMLSVLWANGFVAWVTVQQAQRATNEALGMHP